MDTSVENVRCLRRIARIRRYYAELLPEAPDYFPGTGDDAVDAQAMLGLRYRRASLPFTMASMIGTVNAVLGGTMVALVLEGVLGLPRGPALTLAGATALALVGVALAYEQRRFVAAFPSTERAVHEPG